MFKLPTAHSAFQYECTIVEPEPECSLRERMEDELENRIKPKKNKRLPGERLLKQLHKQEMKEREKKDLFNERIANSISSIMIDLSLFQR